MDKYTLNHTIAIRLLSTSRAFDMPPTLAPDLDLGNARGAFVPQAQRQVDPGRGVDQTEMTESLWKVSEQHLGPRLDLLGEKAQMVRGLYMRYENALSFVDLPRHRENLGQPKSTKDERPLVATNPVIGSVAVQVRAVPELGSDPLHGPEHSIVVWRQEAVDRKQE
jgi:hypothetical protein